MKINGIHPLPALMLALLFALLPACGNQSDAPVDGQLLLSVEESKWEVAPVANCTGSYVPAIYDGTPFRVTVLDQFGLPRGNTTITVSATLTGNTSTGPVVWLLADLNEDGRFDDVDGDGNYDSNGSTNLSEEVIELFPTSGFRELTVNEYGYLDFFLMMDTAGDLCEYAGFVHISSGPLSALMEFSVENP